VGAVFVLVIYIFGRNRRRQKDIFVDELEDDLPEFSARSLDDVDEGVGEVRVVSNAGFAADDKDPLLDMAPDTAVDDSDAADVLFDEPSKNDTAETTEAEPEAESGRKNSGIIVLYILSKPNQKLSGSQINSAAQAMGLQFGEMNIFHYQPGNRIVFSLANMLEPGSFDPDTIHDLKTSGVTIFMQISGNDPLDDLTEMLQRSYQLAGLLDARLCNHKREPLTEQDAENYRSQVRDFISNKAAEPAAET